MTDFEYWIDVNDVGRWKVYDPTGGRIMAEGKCDTIDDAYRVAEAVRQVLIEFHGDPELAGRAIVTYHENNRNPGEG